jgi:hypothetical protein
VIWQAFLFYAIYWMFLLLENNYSRFVLHLQIKADLIAPMSKIAAIWRLARSLLWASLRKQKRAELIEQQPKFYFKSGDQKPL